MKKQTPKPRLGVPLHTIVVTAYQGPRTVYFWFATEQDKDWTLEEINATQTLHGPFNSAAEADTAAQKAILGDDCNITDGGMWDKAWERKQ